MGCTSSTSTNEQYLSSPDLDEYIRVPQGVEDNKINRVLFFFCNCICFLICGDNKKSVSTFGPLLIRSIRMEQLIIRSIGADHSLS